MTSAAELFKAGKLQEAIAAQIQEVKANAADHARRLFLFELLSFSGELDRAERQIDAVKYDDPELDLAVRNYRKMLDAEQSRRKLFSQGLKPEFLVDPPAYVHKHLEAVNCLRDNRPAEAKGLLDSAAAEAPLVKGQLNGKAVDHLRDADDLFANIIEVMAYGKYCWVPLEQVESIAMNPPKFPRDLLWLPARLEFKEGPAGEVFLPVLYPGSHEHADDQIKLGRATDWTSDEAAPVRGVGLRLFLAGDDTVALPEWREWQGE
jgi:type VI secretion system protein ImpE